jgi:hypothetical protein
MPAGPRRPATHEVSVGGSLARLDDTADTLFAGRNRTTIVSAVWPARLDSAEA